MRQTSRQHSTLSAWPLLLLLWLSGSLACGAPPAAPPPSAAVAAPAPTVDPASAVDEAMEGYQLLKDHYVEVIDSRTVLKGGWDKVRDASLKAGAAVLSMGPPTLDGSSRDEQTFRESMTTLVLATGARLTAEELAGAAIDGMASSLKDNHTSFLAPGPWRQRVREAPASVGFWTVPDAAGTMIRNVLNDYPAGAAGLKAGDIIETVDGQPFTSRTQGTLRAGVPAEVRVLRDGERVELRVTPISKPLPTSRMELLEGRVGYVRIFGFAPGGQQGALDEFKRDFDEQLASLKAQQPVAWIIDVRGNSGGSTALAASVAGIFGLKGALAQFKDRAGVLSNVTIPQVANPVSGPKAVLIDVASRSSSELLAAAFQDSKMARIIGVKTGGVVAAARSYPVAGGGLQITRARAIAGISKRELNRVGVTPDEAVTLDRTQLSNGHDAQLERAVAHLLGR